MQGLEYEFVGEAQVREEEESTSEEVFRRRREKRLMLHFEERKSCAAEELLKYETCYDDITTKELHRSHRTRCI